MSILFNGIKNKLIINFFTMDCSRMYDGPTILTWPLRVALSKIINLDIDLYNGNLNTELICHGLCNKSLNYYTYFISYESNYSIAERTKSF